LIRQTGTKQKKSPKKAAAYKGAKEIYCFCAFMFLGYKNRRNQRSYDSLGYTEVRSCLVKLPDFKSGVGR